MLIHSYKLTNYKCAQHIDDYILVGGEPRTAVYTGESHVMYGGRQTGRAEQGIILLHSTVSTIYIRMYLNEYIYIYRYIYNESASQYTQI